MLEKKAKLLEKFIENCPFDGWNDRNIKNSALQLGFENNLQSILFPQGVAELTAYFTELVENEFLQKAQQALANQLKMKEKAKLLMILKLRLYKEKLHSDEAFKKFISYFFNPLNAITGLKGVYNFASDSWYLMNDKSTDFSYYTKRFSFGTIYAKAAIYALNDESDNLANTEKFIERKIDDLMKINKIKLKFNELVAKFN